MNKLLVAYELSRPFRYGCCLIKLYLQLMCIRKNGLRAPADIRLYIMQLLVHKAFFHEQLHLLCRITLPTFLGN